MKYTRDRTWLEVDLGVIERNYRNIANVLGSRCGIIAVLKANAYGLGATGIARVFETLGCPMFAVATIEEAMELRENGIQTPVLVLAPVNPKYAPLAAEKKIILTLTDRRQAASLSNAARAAGKKVAGHLKVDSGLSRLGMVIKNRLQEAVEEMENIMALPGLEVTGVFTHTTGFGGRDGFVAERAELELFDRAVSGLRMKIPQLKIHCLSSSTLLSFPEYRYDFVRVGVLYMGMQPDYSQKFGVEQAVSLKTRVVQVKRLDQGTPVSYEATYVTSRPTTAALVSIGYADGLRRSLSNRGHMILRGKRAPIIGKICCDYTILDVTDIRGVREGDVATIFGRDGGIGQYPYDYAVLYPASISEVTATLTSRIPRFYTGEGVVLGKKRRRPASGVPRRRLEEGI